MLSIGAQGGLDSLDAQMDMEILRGDVLRDEHGAVFRCLPAPFPKLIMVEGVRGILRGSPVGRVAIDETARGDLQFQIRQIAAPRQSNLITAHPL